MNQAACIKLPEILRLGQLDDKKVRQSMADARGHCDECVNDLPPDFLNGVPL